jgi:hypothetical protein
MTAYKFPRWTKMGITTLYESQALGLRSYRLYNQHVACVWLGVEQICRLGATGGPKSGGTWGHSRYVGKGHAMLFAQFSPNRPFDLEMHVFVLALP